MVVLTDEIRGWLRQEENHYISFTREETLKMDKDVQKVIGYQLSEPFLGWVKSTDPMVVLDPSVAVSMPIFLEILC